VNSNPAHLGPGVRIAHYEILSAIGRGGMGEVWKARDTTLHRDVAIKALPETRAHDPDRLARLEREATVLASLNHPNIASIFGLEVSGHTRVLVLELVEGETLADRLQRAPMAVDDVLKIALQMADALESAHDKGIVHRDLKPSNVKITPEGRVKILDFGLAKAIEVASIEAAATVAAPTETAVIVGTPAYMSPEQARGETIGRQSDIWSFGVVVYELLTGRSPFAQQTSADTLAQVLNGHVDYSNLPSGTPPVLRDLVRRCLERNPRRRIQHIGDARIELEDAIAGAMGQSRDESPQRSAATRNRWGIVGAIAAIVTAVVVGVAGWLAGYRLGGRSAATTIRVSIPFAESAFRQPYGISRLAVSADGSQIAFVSASRLWIRRIDAKDPVSIAGSGTDPFFSPDGQWVGLFDQSAQLIKVRVSGGPAVVLASTPNRPAGATWGTQGTIVFATTEGLYQVAENGGAPSLIARPDRQRKERLYAWPSFLPDGKSLLYTIVPDGPVDGAQIAVLDLATRRSTIVLRAGTTAQYHSTGHILFMSGPTLKAVAFDAGTRQTHGDATPLPDVDVGTSGDNGAADFAISDSGTLVYLPPAARPNVRTLVWTDHSGREEVLPIKAGSYAYPRISPDGTRVALDVTTGGPRDIWILDLRRMALTQLTDGPTEDMLPVWSRDGTRVFFASDRKGNFDLYSQPADGATEARLEFASPGFQTPQSFTPDGTKLIVYEDFKDSGILDLARPDHLAPLFHTEFEERLVQVSPDGRFVAYESDESGARFQVFIRPFPNVSDRREQVSLDGGRYPLWNRKDGSELYYVNLDGDVMAVPITLTPRLAVGKASKLFHWEKPPMGRSGLIYDMSPIDGRFLWTKLVDPAASERAQVSVVLNFVEALRRPR
jgi:eukaryotic-like serine/threonine-protein kinase